MGSRVKKLLWAARFTLRRLEIGVVAAAKKDEKFAAV